MASHGAAWHVGERGLQQNPCHRHDCQYPRSTAQAEDHWIRQGDLIFLPSVLSEKERLSPTCVVELQRMACRPRSCSSHSTTQDRYWLKFAEWRKISKGTRGQHRLSHTPLAALAHDDCAFYVSRLVLSHVCHGMFHP